MKALLRPVENASLRQQPVLSETAWIFPNFSGKIAKKDY